MVIIMLVWGRGRGRGRVVDDTAAIKKHEEFQNLHNSVVGAFPAQTELEKKSQAR